MATRRPFRGSKQLFTHGARLMARRPRAGMETTLAFARPHQVVVYLRPENGLFGAAVGIVTHPVFFIEVDNEYVILGHRAKTNRLRILVRPTFDTPPGVAFQARCHLIRLAKPVRYLLFGLNAGLDITYMTGIKFSSGRGTCRQNDNQ